MNTRQSFPALIFLAVLSVGLVLAPPMHSQKKPAKSAAQAYSSPHGIYVFCGVTVASTAHPVGDTVGYRIERRMGSAPWKAIADISAAASFEEFRIRISDSLLTRAVKSMKAPSAAAVWDSVLAKPTLAKLPYIPGTAGMMALGTLLLDKDVTKGAVYSYRISTLLRSGAAVKPRETGEIEFGKAWAIASMTVLRREESDSAAKIEWMTKGAKPYPQRFEVWRRMTGQEAYRRLAHDGGFSLRHDTLVCTFYDRKLRRNQQYDYYVIPVDFVENVGPASQVASVFALNPTRLPLPQHLAARREMNGIRLSWRTNGLDVVLSTRIYRSVHFDSGYIRIAEVPSIDTTYLDQSARGMVNYYYRFSNVSYDNRESQKSATVFGYWVSPLPPVTPGGLKAEAVKRGVALTWTAAADGDLAGWYVYRMEALDDTIGGIVSPLLTVPHFLDTSVTLRGDNEYRYALVALSTSQKRSARSVEARARPLIPTNPKPPRDVEASAMNGIIVVRWDDARAYEPHVAAYVVYRQEKGAATSSVKKLARIAGESEQLSYLDSSAAIGTTYVYAVSSIDAFGYEGLRSAGAEAVIKIVSCPPPATVHASAVNDAVLVEWDDVFDANAASFVLYRQEQGKKPEKIATETMKQRTFTDKRVKKGTTYYYSVAVLSVKGVEGPRSPSAYAIP